MAQPIEPPEIHIRWDKLADFVRSHDIGAMCLGFHTATDILLRYGLRPRYMDSNELLLPALRIIHDEKVDKWIYASEDEGARENYWKFAYWIIDWKGTQDQKERVFEKVHSLLDRDGKDSSIYFVLNMCSHTIDGRVLPENASNILIEILESDFAKYMHQLRAVEIIDALSASGKDISGFKGALYTVHISTFNDELRKKAKAVWKKTKKKKRDRPPNRALKL